MNMYHANCESKGGRRVGESGRGDGAMGGVMREEMGAALLQLDDVNAKQATQIRSCPKM